MSSTGFGWIKINDRLYENDVIVLANGTVLGRNEERLRRKYGTGHAIDEEEIGLLLEGKPDVIVIGLGQSGMARITDKAYALIKKSPVRLVEGSTPNALKKFDELKCEKAGLFHVTC